MASSLSSSSSLGQIRDSLHATPSETMWAIRLSAIDLGMGVHAVAAAQYYFACGAAHGLTIKEVEVCHLSVFVVILTVTAVFVFARKTNTH
eukprot:Selendium_serpulae@DN10744_c0_g1_i1.p1